MTAIPSQSGIEQACSFGLKIFQGLVNLVIGAYLLCSPSAATAAMVQVAPPEVQRIVKPTGERVDALGDPLPPNALMRFGTGRFHHPGSVSGLLLSKDETIVVTTDMRFVLGWDAVTGKELWRKTRPSAGGNTDVGAAGYGIQTLDRIPETGQFVGGAGVGRIAVWEPENGDYQIIQVPGGVTSKSVAVSPDSKLLALGDGGGLVVCARDGSEVYSIPNQPASPLNYNEDTRDRLAFGGDFSYGKFSPDGRMLALVNSEKPTCIQLRDAATGNLIRECAGTAQIVRMEFSPDSQRIATTERDIAARLYEVSSGKQLWELILPPAGKAESYTSAVAFRPDGQQIAVGASLGSDETIRLLDSGSGTETGRLTGSAWKPWTLNYTADSKSIFASGWDQAVRRWDLTTGQQLPFPGGVRASSVCAMSDDDQKLAFVDDDRQIHLVTVPSFTTTAKLQIPEVNWGQVVFSDDGALLAGGGASAENVHVAIWNVANGQLLHHWEWPKGKDPHSNVEALRFSANGNRLAAAVFRQSAAFVWDLATNRQITKVPHTRVYGVDIDAAGTTLITAGWDQHIRIWNCDTGMETNSRSVDSAMYAVVLSHDESFIATIDMDEYIRTFDRSLNPISAFSFQSSVSYGALQISHNDLWIAVGRSSGAVQLFDVTTGSLVWSTRAHEREVYTVDFGARDQTVLSGAEDGQCYLWNPGWSDMPFEETPAELFEYLVGPKEHEAFVAYHQLTQTPEVTLPLIVNWLQTTSDAGPDPAQARHWIAALGSGDAALVDDAKSQLIAGGTAFRELLQKELAKERDTGAKKTHVQDVVRRIDAVSRRVVALLTILKTPEADKAIDRLLQSNQSDHIKQLLQRSQVRRKRWQN